MGHTRINRVRAWDKGDNDPFPKRLDKNGFHLYSKLEKKGLTLTVKTALGIKSIDELCWVCQGCGHRNGCVSSCSLKKACATGFTLTFQPTVVSQVVSDPVIANTPIQAPQSPHPTEESTEATCNKAQSDYVLNFLKEHFIPLTKGKGGHLDKKALRENKVYSDCVILPNPRHNPKLQVGGVCVRELAEAWACAGCVVKVVDYEMFEEDCAFYCPCQLAKKNQKLHRNGLSHHARIERSFGVVRFIVSYDYVCSSCDSAGPGKTSTFSTISPTILNQLPDTIRASLDFVVLSDKLIVSRATQNLIVASIEQGGSGFGNLEDVSSRVLGTELACREVERQFELIRLKKRGTLNLFALKRKLSDFVASRVVTAKVASTVFTVEVTRMMPFIQAVFVLAAMSCAVFCMDMNYPWGNAGSAWGAYGLFHLFSSNGEVFAGQAFTSKSPSEMFMALSKLLKAKLNDTVPIAAFISDQPRVDMGVVHAVLGAQVEMRKDLLSVMLCFAQNKLISKQSRFAGLGKTRFASAQSSFFVYAGVVQVFFGCLRSRHGRASDQAKGGGQN